MRYFCWNLVSTPSANSDGYPILKMLLGSNSVRGRKNRKKARNQAVRKAVTMVQTKRRRLRSISVEGAVPATPPAAAAFEVPTAGVPTYFVASTAGLAGVLAASGFGLTLSVSNSAMIPPLPDFSCLALKLVPGGGRVLWLRQLPPNRTNGNR